MPDKRYDILGLAAVKRRTRCAVAGLCAARISLREERGRSWHPIVIAVDSASAKALQAIALTIATKVSVAANVEWGALCKKNACGGVLAVSVTRVANLAKSLKQEKRCELHGESLLRNILNPRWSGRCQSIIKG